MRRLRLREQKEPPPLKLEGAGPTQGTEIAKLSKGGEVGSDRKWREGNWQPS